MAIRCIVVGGDVLDAPYNVELVPYGRVAEKYINQLNEFYDDISIEKMHMIPAKSLKAALEKAKAILHKTEVKIVAIPDGISIIVKE